MTGLDSIRAQIVRSGGITSGDVAALRAALYEDGKIDRAEAEFLFALRKDLAGFARLRAWDNFFIQAICDFVLDDDRSPNAIDDFEARWLIEQIGEDGIIDDVELKLLKRLRLEAKHFPKSLGAIQSHTSVAKELGRKIFLLLCGNTKTLRSMEFGVATSGQHKTSVYHIRTNTKSDDDDHESEI